MYVLPNVTNEQLACIVAALRLTAEKSREPGFKKLADWLLSHSYEPTMPPDVAATMKWALDTKRKGPLELRRTNSRRWDDPSRCICGAFQDQECKHNVAPCERPG